MGDIKDLLGLGVEPKNLEWYHVCFRALLVFCWSLILSRMADKRFLAKLSAFDVILGFVMASMLSRTINGSAPLLPSLAAGLMLVLLHRVLGTAAVHSHLLSIVLKGRADVLVKEGSIDERQMRRNKISEADLLEEARLQGKVENISDIRLATIERNGEISILPLK